VSGIGGKEGLERTRIRGGDEEEGGGVLASEEKLWREEGSEEDHLLNRLSSKLSRLRDPIIELPPLPPTFLRGLPGLALSTPGLPPSREVEERVPSW
jgi:hypothetical protein